MNIHQKENDMKKSISVLLVITMLITLVIPVLSFTVVAVEEPTPVSTAQSGISYYNGTPTTAWYGDGSATTFTLSSASDLYGLAMIVNEGRDTFSGDVITLDTDIVINGGDLKDPSFDTSSVFAWEPIGKDGTYKFSGTFNGNGHVISGLFISKINN